MLHLTVGAAAVAESRRLLLTTQPVTQEAASPADAVDSADGLPAADVLL